MQEDDKIKQNDIIRINDDGLYIDSNYSLILEHKKTKHRLVVKTKALKSRIEYMQKHQCGYLIKVGQCKYSKVKAQKRISWKALALKLTTDNEKLKDEIDRLKTKNAILQGKHLNHAKKNYDDATVEIIKHLYVDLGLGLKKIEKETSFSSTKIRNILAYSNIQMRACNRTN